MELLPFILAAVFAEAAGTFTGFGATTILLPITSFIFPIQEAIVLVGTFHFFGTLWRSLLFARGINIKIALLFGIPSLILSAFGASLLTQIDSSTLTKIVGLLLIIYAAFSLFKEKLSLPKNEFVLITGGGVVGFLAGLIGTAGALRGAFLTAWRLPKNIYLGTSALMGLGADISRVAVYKRSGILTLPPNDILLLAGIALAGTILGKLLVGHAKEKTFSKIVFVALILAGIRLTLI